MGQHTLLTFLLASSIMSLALTTRNLCKAAGRTAAYHHALLHYSLLCCSSVCYLLHTAVLLTLAGLLDELLKLVQPGLDGLHNIVSLLLQTLQKTMGAEGQIDAST